MPPRDATGTVDYWVPLVVFGVFTSVEGYAPLGWYPWLYLTKIGAVSAAMAVYPKGLRRIVPSGRVAIPAVAVGLLVFAQWILLDRWIPYPHLGTRTAFDPFTAFASRPALLTMLAGRFFGLVVLVPIIEEMFWRDFMLRFVTDADFERVPLGTYSRGAFVMVAAGFAITHPEWVVALVAGCLFALLLKWTRSLFAVVVSHATANLALGVYILLSHEWRYW